MNAVAVKIYKTAKAENGSIEDGVYALMTLGYSQDQAADLCWRIETSHSMPAYLNDPNSAESRAWSAKADQGHEEGADDVVVVTLTEDVTEDDDTDTYTYVTDDEEFVVVESALNDRFPGRTRLI